MGDGLSLAVIQVGEREALVVGPDLHLLERIAEVRVAQLVEPHCLGVVRGDGHQRHALAGIVVMELLDPFLIGLGRRAVVAGEDDNQHGGRGEALERVPASVDTRQLEVRGRRADRQRGDEGSLVRPRGAHVRGQAEKGERQEPCRLHGDGS